MVEPAIAGRTRFQRRYGLAADVLPASVLEQSVSDEDAVRELLRRAAVAHGIGTARDFADYYRIKGPRVSVALAANAGSYTMPSYPGVMDDKFPYALDEGIVSPDKLKQVFARKLIVLLGEADIQTDAANLPKARQASAQGVNRFERGTNFFAQATAQAQKLGTPLAWERVTVPGVGHDSRRMSQAAARLLFEPAR